MSVVHRSEIERTRFSDVGVEGRKFSIVVIQKWRRSLWCGRSDGSRSV